MRERCDTFESFPVYVEQIRDFHSRASMAVEWLYGLFYMLRVLPGGWAAGVIAGRCASAQLNAFFQGARVEKKRTFRNPL